MEDDHDDTYVGDCDFLDDPSKFGEDDEDYEDDDEDEDEDYEDEELQFADPGGKSALRAATPRNPRNLPCPTCKEPNRLTPKDVACGYQCDSCANRAERGGY